MTIKLVNGPCDGWTVSPACPIQMGIHRELPDGKIEVGRAIYEVCGSKGFWLHNLWDGILIDTIP